MISRARLSRLVGGRYDRESRQPREDLHGRSRNWMDYFKDGQVSEPHARRLQPVREILTSDGRTPPQGRAL